jgi:diaminohydroxyphosphoribosylaminopyrimidine deaminase/5-amino-6-(5-phosphoribosylamino)uracil reductase
MHPLNEPFRQGQRGNDERYMRLALCHARKGLGKTSPNPAVGTVIVRDEVVLSAGWHKKAGDPHAEIEALTALSGNQSAKGATLYVTLEPCSTRGRTPPCTEAIVAAKPARVVIGSIDMNPKHRGRGIEQLRNAGIAVSTGILDTDCRRLNVGFNKWIVSGKPWVIAKVAQSLDGRITRPPGESQRLTNNRSLKLSHRLRSTVDAILVGAETIRKDNPGLTVRPIQGRLQPWRIVLTRSGNLPASAKVFTDEFRDRTIVYQDVAWSDLLNDLGSKGVTRLLVEGGSDTLGQLCDQNLIDEFWCFIAPLFTGGDKPGIGGSGAKTIIEAHSLDFIRYKRVGDDVLMVGYVQDHFNIQSPDILPANTE